MARLPSKRGGNLAGNFLRKNPPRRRKTSKTTRYPTFRGTAQLYHQRGVSQLFEARGVCDGKHPEESLTDSISQLAARFIWVVYLSFRKFELLYPPHPYCGRKFSTVTLRAAAGGEAIPLSARRLLSPRCAPPRFARGRRDMRCARNDRRQRLFHGFRATRCEFLE